MRVILARIAFIALFVAGLLAIVMLLSGCTTTPPDMPPGPPPAPPPMTVNVPLPTPCAPQITPEPNYPDTREAILAAPFPGAEDRLMANPMDTEAMGQVLDNLRHRVRLLAAGWPLKNARIAELTAALKACE
jgi:hypothetical protein